MMYLHSWGSTRLAVGVVTLFCALHSEASLLDCAQIPEAELTLSAGCSADEAPQLLPFVAPSAETPASPPPVTNTGFQVNPKSSNGLPSSILLMGFFASLISVLLVRAKGFNSK
ncbi:MAG TPA: hypothetical protein VL995_18850 [Cellvibrio sp.]|nr:hypothetical protein [Cellvibrio sp.]